MSTPKLFIENLNTLQTLLGLDFGDKTIGIAISDKTHTIATHVKTINRKGIKKDILELIELFREYNVGGIVLGLPLSLNGKENERTKKVRVFAKQIKAHHDIKITFYDERCSSDVIYKELRKNGLSSSKIKKKINQLAASYILQGYLDAARIN